MPVRTHLSDDDLVDIVDGHGMGLNISQLCRQFRIGRGRCSLILAKSARADRDEAVEAAGVLQEMAGAGAAKAEPQRTTAHFVADEPPKPELAKINTPVIVKKVEPPKPDAKTKSTGAAKKRATTDEAITAINKAGMAVQIGSDDKKVVDAGLAAITTAKSGGAMNAAEAAGLRRSLTAARHEPGGEEAGVLAAAFVDAKAYHRAIRAGRRLG